MYNHDQYSSLLNFHYFEVIFRFLAIIFFLRSVCVVRHLTAAGKFCIKAYTLES